MPQQTITIEQLGAQIRQQNPSGFDGYSDVQIGQRALQKKPELKNIIKASVAPPKDAEDFGTKVKNFLSDFKFGVVKGLASTVKGTSELGERALNSTLQTVLPKSGPISEESFGVNNAPNLGLLTPKRNGTTSAQKIQSEAETRLRLPQGELTTPRNFAQKAGFATEQVGEFLAPGPAGLRIAGKVDDVLRLRNTPKFLRGVGKVGANAGIEAITGGGITALQNGDIDSAVISNAIIGGSLPVIFKGAEKALAPFTKFLSEKLPSKLINNLIRPGKNDFNFGKNPGKSIVDEGITANSREGLLKSISSKMDEIDALKQSAFDAVPEGNIINIADSLKPIDDAIQEAVGSGERALVSRLQDIKDGLTKEFNLVDGSLEAVGSKNLLLSPREADALKRKIGRDTKWTNQAFDTDVNQVRVKLYSNLNEAIDRAVGDLGGAGGSIKELNGRLSNLLTAQKALENRIAVQARNNLVSLQDVTLGTGVGVGSAVSGADPLTSIARVIGGIFGRKVLNSTAFRTRAGQVLSNLSPQEVSSLEKIAPLLRAIILETNKD